MVEILERIGTGTALVSYPITDTRRTVRPRGGPLRFAHPAEEELARILSFYGIRWLYEPTSFVLDQDLSGRVLESLTPDFYLPDADLYLELTTMRQSLVTRKNRKIRMLRQRYPEVQIKLLYRRDFERLLRAHGQASDETEIAQRAGVAFEPALIAQTVDSLADQLADSWPRSSLAGAPPLLLLSGPSRHPFMNDLANGLLQRGIHFERDNVQMLRYRTDGSRSEARIWRRPTTTLSGRQVILVTDMISTGLSSAFMTRWLYRHGVASVDLCTLLDRAEARWADVPIRYRGLTAPGGLLVGYGLQVDGRFSRLPHIAVLE